jgi:hypothetical protein
MRTGLFLALVLWAASSAAQTMYKCLDANRRVTYSNETCAKQGLTDGGQVADRVTTMPFTQPPKPAATGALPTVKVPVPPADDARDGSTARIKPVNPLIEKLAK